MNSRDLFYFVPDKLISWMWSDQNQWQEYRRIFLNLERWMRFGENLRRSEMDELETELPDELVIDFLSKSEEKFYLGVTEAGGKILRSFRHRSTDTEFSMMSAYKQYGKEVLYEAREKGSFSF